MNVDNPLNNWDQHKTPFSPEPLKQEAVKNDVTETKCSIKVRHVRKPVWFNLMQLEKWYSLPYKFVYRITTPIASKASQLEINLIREFDAVNFNNHIHCERRNSRLLQKNCFEFSVYFSTSSYAENNSKFIIQVKHTETREILFTSHPTAVLTRKRKPTIPKKKKRMRFTLKPTNKLLQ